MGHPVTLNSLSAPSVRLFYQNPAGLTPEQISGAFKGVQGLYGPVTLDAQPWDASGPMPTGNYYRVVFGKGNNPVLGGETAGQTPKGGNVVYVYPQTLQKDYGQQEFPSALEEVLGHEMGHALGLGHTLSGLMSAQVSPKTLEQNLTPLSSGQIRRIEKNMAKLSSLAR